MKKNIFIAVTSLFFISRFFLFISTQDVGVEHDSGWYLGVARNVAERGIYASYTNTVAASDKLGSFPSIFGRFSAQDKNGFVYFPAGVTVGPGYVFPEAFFLKLFGVGWVQYRLWPFIAFCLLIPLLFFIVYEVGSVPGLLFFQLWIWLYPQIFVNQSFEAFSEHIALLFLLLGYVLLQRAVSHKKKLIFYILAGLSLGVSFQTKGLYLIGIVVPVLWTLYFAVKTKQLKYFFIFSISLLLPTILFELYRFIALTSLFGLVGYWQNNIDIKRTMQSGGSGVNILKSGVNLRFVYDKLVVWKHIGVSPFTFVWPLIFASPFFKKKNSFLFWNIFFSTLIFFTWFSLFSSTGWFRHIFPGVLMGMILISISFNGILTSVVKTKKWRIILLFCLFLAQILSAPFLNRLSIPYFEFSKARIISLFQSPSPNSLGGPVSHAIFSKKDQDEVVSAIKSHINNRKRFCFEQPLFVAELPPLVDVVFFPIQRCKDGDILVVGPYQKGIYSLKNTNLPYIEKNICKKTIFSNNSYTLCLIKKK